MHTVYKVANSTSDSCAPQQLSGSTLLAPLLHYASSERKYIIQQIRAMQKKAVEKQPMTIGSSEHHIVGNV